MAQPSVAREPSMEEILASIRRIIESNEPGAVPGEQDVQLESEADFAAGEQAAADSANASHPVVADSMGMPLRAANTAVPPRAERDIPAASAEGKPQSLADIAARVRNASERAVPAAPFREQPEPAVQRAAPPQTFADRPVAAVPQPPRSVLPDDALRPSVPLRDPEPAQPASLPSFDAAAISAAGEMIARYETETVPAAPAEVAPAPVAAYSMPAPESEAVPFDREPAAEPAALSLLSSETGAIVARSFGELAEAMDGAQRRSLDEVAEELLRPMLREWLDDNLPTLVERLVREEIERVARGPRR